MRHRPRPFGTLVLISMLAGCGGDNSVTPPPPTTTTTIAAQPSPSPTPTATPTPPVAQECTLAPGPVTRLAISPRELRTDGATADVWVRARSGWDEVVCLDNTKTHRLDFNANQRNADGRESCYEGDVAWRVVEDGDGMISDQSSRHEDGFIWRYNIDPRGRNGSIDIEAQLDGVLSHPWQSGSGYRREPLRIVAMSRNEMERDCNCIFRGNGVYEGARCPK
jgi:hypothetical protein